MQIELAAIPAPIATDLATDPPAIPRSEYERRIQALYDGAGADWVVVYGDREHTGNLVYLCGFDPRFEEALLLIGRDRRCLVVGNEGLGYTSVVTVPLEILLAQSLSLMGQPRSEAPRLADVLRAAGVAQGARVGVVGWKYLEPDEDDEPAAPAFVPAVLVHVLRRLIGSTGTLFDATRLLHHPVDGLTIRSTASQIAAAAWWAERAALAVQRIVRGARPGMTEREAAGLMGYQGDPLACHMMMVSSDGPVVGLRSPSGRRLAYGDGVTTAIGYRGGLCCRAGLLRGEPDQSFVETMVTPYFRAIAAWWGTVRAGMTGGEVHSAVLAALAGAAFQPALNPGHLTGVEEWTHSPIRPNSGEPIVSGMLLQCDIIPAPMPAGWALNCEDTAAVADAALRAELRAGYPELWARIEARQSFMRTALGIALPDDLLPLSVAPAYLAPFWLAADLVCRVG